MAKLGADTDQRTARPDNDSEVDAVMAAARVLIAVVARSMADVEDQVTLPQWRVLVLIGTRGPLNMSAVADALGVHASNATRTVDRLVSAGLVDRQDAPDNRRTVRLTLTTTGERLLESVFDRRRAAVELVMERMPENKRRSLRTALEAFARAAGEPPEDQFGELRWTRRG